MERIEPMHFAVEPEGEAKAAGQKPKSPDAKAVTKEPSVEQKRNAIIKLLAEQTRENEKLLKEYWMKMDYYSQEAKREMARGRRSNESITNDLLDMEEDVRELIKRGIYPVLSVRKQHMENIKKQNAVKAKETHIPGVRLIAAALGIEPYAGLQGEDRVFLRVLCEPDDVKPRATGEDFSYHGIVVFRNDHIPLAKTEDITDQVKGYFAAIQTKKEADGKSSSSG